MLARLADPASAIAKKGEHIVSLTASNGGFGRVYGVASRNGTLRLLNLNKQFAGRALAKKGRRTGAGAVGSGAKHGDEIADFGARQVRLVS